MTFFANSGVKFPNLEQPTREAGQRALEGAADLWRLFANIEGRIGETKPHEQSMRQVATANLEQALAIYRGIINDIPPQSVTLSPAEIELIGGYDVRFLHEWPHPAWQWDLRELYLELIKRLEILIGQLRSTEITAEKQHLVQPVFSMMKQWETLALLGRIISVVNQKRTSLPDRPMAS